MEGNLQGLRLSSKHPFLELPLLSRLDHQATETRHFAISSNTHPLKMLPGITHCRGAQVGVRPQISADSWAAAEARLRTGLTQTALAEKLGRHQSSVSKFENGERRLDVIEFLDVARALRLDPVRVIAELGRK
jgi:DNA-binding XRE family transcriptional regulator